MFIFGTVALTPTVMTCTVGLTMSVTSASSGVKTLYFKTLYFSTVKTCGLVSLEDFIKRSKDEALTLDACTRSGKFPGPFAKRL
jgi:hypothetical protein